MASLTKPLITAFSFVYLMQKEKIDLDSNIRGFFPEMPFDVTLVQLLTHTSGLPASFPFYLYGNDYLNQFKHLKLESRPGNRVNYSCAGYILLYFIIKKISGLDFTDFVNETIINKLDLKNTFLKVPPDLKRDVGPTEAGNLYEKKMVEKKYPDRSKKFNWRDALIQGETHDANSFYKGGSAGNSGLFSTTGDLFNLSQEFFPSTATLLKPESVKLFWKNFTPFKGGHRSIGFKLNSSLITSGGRAISTDAIGHNGFTGTSIWMEPETRYVYIILTNRIHPHVKNFNFNRVRRKLHRLIKSDLKLK